MRSSSSPPVSVESAGGRRVRRWHPAEPTKTGGPDEEVRPPVRSVALGLPWGMTSDGYAGLSADGEGDGEGARDRLVHDEVVRLEVLGWEALSAGAEEATAFYREVLDDDVVMLLPGGLTLRSAAAVLPVLGVDPWRGFRIADAEVRHPVPDVALLTYAVSAHRGGPPYEALVTSVYARRAEGWRMVLHQQTPDAS